MRLRNWIFSARSKAFKSLNLFLLIRHLLLLLFILFVIIKNRCRNGFLVCFFKIILLPSPIFLPTKSRTLKMCFKWILGLFAFILFYFQFVYASKCVQMAHILIYSHSLNDSTLKYIRTVLRKLCEAPCLKSSIAPSFEKTEFPQSLTKSIQLSFLRWQ